MEKTKMIKQQKQQITKREKNKMNLLEKLLDLTNYDWRLNSRDGSYVWMEDEHSLDVIVAPDKASKGKAVIVKNGNGGPEIRLEENQLEAYLLIAVSYAQLADSEHGMPEGSVDDFWKLAEAYRVLGGQPAFGKSEDGIHCHVGERMPFLCYENGRYVLFDEGIRYYAATPAGLLRAYRKLIAEIDLWSAIKDEQTVQKTQQ